MDGRSKVMSMKTIVATFSTREMMSNGDRFTTRRQYRIMMPRYDSAHFYMCTFDNNIDATHHTTG